MAPFLPPPPPPAPTTSVPRKGPDLTSPTSGLLQSSSPGETLQTVGLQSLPRAPPLAWLWGPEPPCLPDHCARCGCRGGRSTGLSWQWSLGGPHSAESASSGSAHQASSCSTSSGPPSRGRAGIERSRLGGPELPFPVRHKSHQCPFLSCPPRCQGLAGGGGGVGTTASFLLPPASQKCSDPQWASWPFPLQSREDSRTQFLLCSPNPLQVRPNVSSLLRGFSRTLSSIPGSGMGH